MTLVDRSGPGVRITLLDNERAPSGEPLDLAGRIIAFTYEDAEKKADQVSLQLDNFDLALFERAELVSGATLEISWGYPGNMAPPRRVDTISQSAETDARFLRRLAASEE